MHTTRHITDDCVAIALYGGHANAQSLATVYSLLIEWFGAVECAPNKLAVRGHGFGGKPVSFDRTHSRLLKKGFADVESFSLYCMLPQGKTPTVDWWATASLSSKYKYLVVQARSSVTSMEDEETRNLIEGCVRSLTPAYGIGFYRNHNKGPAFYAIGLNYVTIENVTGDDDADSISRWGDVGMSNEVYKQGFIRDVYPYNYLTEPHLTMLVDNNTLKEWISTSADHGTLTQVSENMVLWKVADKQVDSVRDKLAESGIIFDWTKYEQE